MYMRRIADAKNADQRFDASLHGVQMADREGRVSGARQAAMARAKRRARGEHV